MDCRKALSAPNQANMVKIRTTAYIRNGIGTVALGNLSEDRLKSKADHSRTPGILGVWESGREKFGPA